VPVPENEGSGGRLVLYLVMGVFWVGLAVVLLYAHFTGRAVPRLSDDGVQMLALLALLLATYNFVRWWARRVSMRARQQREVQQRRRRNESPPVEYDPTFDFTGREPPKPPLSQ
jgi:hypothetical protein